MQMASCKTFWLRLVYFRLADQMAVAKTRRPLLNALDRAPVAIAGCQFFHDLGLDLDASRVRAVVDLLSDLIEVPDTNVVERSMRPLATRRSFCTPSSSV